MISHFLKFDAARPGRPTKTLRQQFLFYVIFQAAISSSAQDVNRYPYKNFFAWPQGITELKVITQEGQQKTISVSPEIEYVSGVQGRANKSIVFYKGKFAKSNSVKCLHPQLGRLEHDFHFNPILGKSRVFKVKVPAGATVFGICGEPQENLEEFILSVIDPAQSIEILFEDLQENPQQPK